MIKMDIQDAASAPQAAPSMEAPPSSQSFGAAHLAGLRRGLVFFVVLLALLFVAASPATRTGASPFASPAADAKGAPQ
ncbi:MAG: hypothetical protein AB1508_15455 [Pseudomonadota bacterium]